MRRLLLASAMLLTTAASADTTRHDGEEIVRLASDSLSAQVRARHPELTRFEVVPIGRMSRVRPAGDALVPRLLTDRRLGHRVRVWVDVMQGGLRVASVPVWFSLHTYRSTLIATHSLRPKQPVQSGDVTQVEHEVTGADDMLSDIQGVDGKRVKRYVPVGAALRASDLEVIPAVLSEQKVAVHVVAGSFDIETTGIAEQEGRLGETILVRNPSSDTSFRAQVTSRNRVEVVTR